LKLGTSRNEIKAGLRCWPQSNNTFEEIQFIKASNAFNRLRALRTIGAGEAALILGTAYALSTHTWPDRIQRHRYVCVCVLASTRFSLSPLSSRVCLFFSHSTVLQLEHTLGTYRQRGQSSLRVRQLLMFNFAPIYLFLPSKRPQTGC
jgi:hypothetical protein